MGKKKPTQVDRANVMFTQLVERQLVRCDVSDGAFKDYKWSFFVPLSSVDRVGSIPTDIVKSRMRHDFNVELGLYSVTTAIEQ